MKIAIIIARILMGLMFLNASIGYFFNLYPAPPKLPDNVATYMAGISVVHLLEIVKAIELLCAIAFLAGRYVALANIVLLPITFNILLMHAMIDPSSLAIIVIVFLLHLFLIYAYRKHYITLFKAKRID
jgi:putative oxidoreductase